MNRRVDVVIPRASLGDLKAGSFRSSATMEPVSKPTPFGGARRLRSRRSQRLETTGLIVVAILILAITITRYWHNIHWSAR